MAASNDTPEIILFHYPFSPYGQKVHRYLALRNIAHKQCFVSHMMPRPELAALGITYRRIPVLSVDNSMLIDTRLILAELQARLPAGALPATAAERWRDWAVALFPAATGCMPSALPLMHDAAFLADRADYLGGIARLTAADLDAARPANLRRIEAAFAEVEARLAGQEWLEGGSRPGLADVEAVWLLAWLKDVPGAFAGSAIAQDKFPRTWAWIDRLAYRPAADNVVSGEQARDIILRKWKPLDGEAQVEAGCGVQAGEEAEVLPVDTGRMHPQKGRVRAVTAERVLLEVVPPGEENGGRALTAVFPRQWYEVRSAGARGGSEKL